MNGLPSCIVYELEVEDAAGKIYAATFARGIWSSDLYSACASNYSLTPANDPSNPNYTGVQFYEAGNSITSTRIITGGIGTDVTYQAGNYVDLTTGFQARAGNLFAATNASCNAILSPLQTPASGIFVYKNLDDENDKPSIISFDAMARNIINAYPNPSKGVFNVEINAIDDVLSISNIQLADQSGKIIRSFNPVKVNKGMQLNFKIDLSDKAAGKYKLLATDENIQLMVELIKAN